MSNQYLFDIMSIMLSYNNNRNNRIRNKEQFRNNNNSLVKSILTRVKY